MILNRSRSTISRKFLKNSHNKNFYINKSKCCLLVINSKQHLKTKGTDFSGYRKIPKLLTSHHTLYLMILSGSYKVCFDKILYIPDLKLILGKVPDLKIANMILTFQVLTMCQILVPWITCLILINNNPMRKSYYWPHFADKVTRVLRG